MKKRSIIWLIIAAAITGADQLVKWLISSTADIGETIASMPLVDIMYVQNRGAAFSLLSGKVSLLSVISIAFCIAAVVYWIKKKPSHPVMQTSITLMFAGALGNAIDRLAYGFVVDFIRVTFIDFPVFNIADIAITVGAALLIVYEIWFDKEVKHADNKN